MARLPGPLRLAATRWLNFGTPSDIGEANATGSSNTLARLDHVHDHGDRSGGTLHAEARRDNKTATPNDGFLTGYMDLRHRQFHQTYKDFGATTLTSTGLVPSVQALGATNNVDNAHGDFMGITTNAVLNESAWLLSPKFGERRQEPMFACKFRSGTATNVRYWIGLYQANPAAMAPPAAANEGMGFSWDSAVYGSGNWRIVTADGGSSTTTDSGVAIANNLVYNFRIECDDLATDAVYFYINGELVHTETATLSGLSTDLLYIISSTNLAAASRTIRWACATLTKEG